MQEDPNLLEDLIGYFSCGFIITLSTLIWFGIRWLNLRVRASAVIHSDGTNEKIAKNRRARLTFGTVLAEVVSVVAFFITFFICFILSIILLPGLVTWVLDAGGGDLIGIIIFICILIASFGPAYWVARKTRQISKSLD